MPPAAPLRTVRHATTLLIRFTSRRCGSVPEILEVLPCCGPRAGRCFFQAGPLWQTRDPGYQSNSIPPGARARPRSANATNHSKPNGYSSFQGTNGPTPYFEGGSSPYCGCFEPCPHWQAQPQPSIASFYYPQKSFGNTRKYFFQDSDRKSTRLNSSHL